MANAAISLSFELISVPVTPLSLWIPYRSERERERERGGGAEGERERERERERENPNRVFTSKAKTQRKCSTSRMTTQDLLVAPNDGMCAFA